MPITSLVKLLAVIVALVVIRLAAFKVFKPPVELPSPPVEATRAQTAEETLEPVSIWPVVVLVSVIVALVAGLMVFGNAIGG